MTAQTLLQLTQPPFDVLTDTERSELTRHAKMIYLAQNETLPTAWQDDFFIIIKGKLTQSQHGELIAGLRAGDWFFAKDKSGLAYDITTQEQSLLYHLAGDAVNAASQKNSALNALLFADLAARSHTQKTRHAHHENQALLHRQIRELGEYISPAHFVDSDASLQMAAMAMTAADAKHVLVVDDAADNDKKMGMFTQTDLCRAIANAADLQSCVRDFSHFPVRTIHQDHEVAEALTTMLEQRMHRLPIVNDAGAIVGVIGQTQLLNFLANHSELISARLDGAQTLDDVAAAVELIGKYIRGQAQNGVKVHVIGRVVQSLNAQVFAKVWQLIATPAVQAASCVIVMGSEGRGEQIMRTDQDNALIIKDGTDEALLQEIQTCAIAFNDALAQLGYPPCDGGIMMANALWRQPLGKFLNEVQSWFLASHGDKLTWLSTLLDAHFVCGDKSLFDALMAHVFEVAYPAATANFINRFAGATLQMGSSARFWAKFTGGHDHDIDLKKAGIFPIVHGTRALALEHGIRTTNTRARLDLLVQAKAIDEKLAKNLQEALDFFLAKRLDVALSTSDRHARKVNPNTLSTLERDLLKESLAVVKEFKGFITRHYRLDVFVG
ncbi:signal transduction protein [Moraxella caviae]|uniref:Putative voltage-gated ClC-type chloride channel ClcB n=1 Tax=Moraxella caviae TaxID=34060 RepID=A0A1T0A511_9GAMM|nr:DUF294 nucleotidyltransferase-like domain-containing protein [Moraxella caviae]OOR90825.1 signal transduction protein [Moraxella caviae]STZ10655.1 putative voltage-gated ClC-type chloride channel ClcB [Moraxella caviae]VEW10562.1 putative voltage-gated ClC-type chloride channel ClcB [Moraxella caviae]